jgi:FG-GAP-like repeat
VSYDPGKPFTNSIAVADVNGDGNPDLVVGNFNDSVGVLLGNGDGSFQLGATYSSQAENSVAAADVNGDGKPDLLVANLYNNVAVLLGNGDGSFQPAVIYEPGGFDASSAIARDVNGDGKPDLLVTNWFVNNQDFQADGVIGVLLGNGDGTFQPASTYDSGGKQPSSIAVADLNGDGKPDLLVGNCSSSGGGANCSGGGVVGVLLGNGDGTFQAAVTYDSGGANAISVAVADVNGDGGPDLFAANACDKAICMMGSVGVLLNNTADTTPPVITLCCYSESLVAAERENGASNRFRHNHRYRLGSERK